MDFVDHTLLVTKLYSVSVKPTVVNWIIQFLRDRSQTVPAGVPQGTCLRPWLFLVVIHDLRPNMENTSLWKFADDGTLSETVHKAGTSSLQNEADAIYQWTLANNFQLNSLKCKKFIITFKKSSIPYESIVFNNLPLERFTNTNLLGLNISNDLGAPSTRIRIRLYSQTFCCGYAYHPHVSSKNANRNRKLLKTVSRVETFENATNLDTCERTETATI